MSTSKPSSTYSVGNLFDEDDSNDNLFASSRIPTSYTTKSSTFASSRPKPTRKSLFSSMPVASNETIPETITKPSMSLKPTSVKSSYTVGNLFDENNTDGTDEDETVSLKSIFSTSNSKPTSTASLFDEDESMSLKPIFSTSMSTSKPTSTLYNSARTSMPSVSDKCEYLNNRIDELQNEMNRKFDEIISRLDN